MPSSRSCERRWQCDMVQRLRRCDARAGQSSAVCATCSERRFESRSGVYCDLLIFMHLVIIQSHSRYYDLRSLVRLS